MKKGLIILIFLLMILAAPFCITSSNLKIDKQLAENLNDKNARVIVVMADNNKIANQISASGVSEQKIKHKFSSFNGFSTELSADEIKALADNPSVSKIYYDSPVHAYLQQSAPLINATLAWTLQISDINITGKGLSACVIDTGINYSHPDLGNCSRQFYVMNGTNISYILESAHNYTNDFDSTWKINYTGSSNIAVHFVNISLESNSGGLDRIRIYDYQMKEIADYHGNGSVIKDFWTPFSNNDTVYVRLTTDSSITDYGFYIDQIRNGTTNSTFDWRNCSKIIYGWDFVNNDADPYDDNGHGTHVSGIIAANGKIKGIAPDAMIVSAKALDNAGSGYLSDILYAMEFCINNSEKFNISVISMSLGDSSANTGYCDSSGSNALYVPLVNNATAKNISIVVASGNDYYTNAMSSPACLSGVISVGATDKSDSFASFSNRNNLTTVVAPGVNINSTMIGAPVGDILTACGTGKSYCPLSGTSMATPHVAGEIILLQQAKFLMNNRYNAVSEIKSLISHGKNVTDSSTGNNFTRIDVYQALSAENATDTQAPVYTWISKPNISSGESVIVNITANDNTGITIYNITLNSQSYQLSKSGDYYSYNITPTSIANITYNITFKDAVGNANITDTVILQINDSSPPYFSNITNQDYVYNASAAYQFNATLQDNIQLSRVWLGFYPNSTNQINYTASNISAVYNVSLTKLAAGNYSFLWYANDSAGNLNYTSLYNFTINQANPSLNLSLNASILSYSNILVENGTFVNITATASAEGPIILYINDSFANIGISSVSNISQFNSTMNVTAFYNSTMNFSSAVITRIVNVALASDAPVAYKISPSDASWLNYSSITFRINATDISLKNATLIVWNITRDINFTNTANLTGTVNETNWTYYLSDGNYSWNAKVYDSSNNFSFAGSNSSLFVDTVIPLALISASSTGIYTDESSLVTCVFSDINLNSASISIAGSVVNSSFTFPNMTYTFLGSSGTKTINCTATDKAGNSKMDSISITVSARPAAGDGSTTGPGSGPQTTTPVITATQAAPMTETTLTISSMTAEIPANVTIPAELANSGITKLEITSKINANNVEVRLKKILAEDVAVKASGEVYNYFNITSSLNESSIKNASISFEVNQSWITGNDINRDTIKLKRYKESWTDLKTEKISEDSFKVYLKAESPGFSLFAIAAEKNAPVAEETQEQPKAKSKIWLIIILAIAVIVLIVLILIAFVLPKR
jgi:PGF-pre-PGF domain-containing protein